MKCLYCGCDDLKVIDTRPGEDGEVIRRRRECTNCGRRFTTFETIEMTPVYVIKNNGNRQQFDLQKIKKGILLSCANRPIPMVEIDKLVKSIEKKIYNSLVEEVSTKYIGELVMAGLKEIDEVAYIRFASVYRQFKDVATFLAEMQKVLADDENKNNNNVSSEGNK